MALIFAGFAASAQKVGVGTGSGTTPAPTPTTGGTTKPNTNTNTGNTNLGFTPSEAGKAIKEALNIAVKNSVNQVSVTDGYFKNNFIKIPFPKEAAVVESTLRQLKLGGMVDKVIVSMNRAAESAAKQAGPIFLNAITQMTVTDAVSIVSNQQTDAATRFLERTTTEQLVVAFKPSIKAALDKTLATKYWKDVMTRYNQIPFVRKVNPDLNDYVTRKAITGLFYVMAQEEAKIRKDPVKQTTDILDKVFGSLLGKK